MDPRHAYYHTIALYCQDLALDCVGVPGIAAETSRLEKSVAIALEHPSEKNLALLADALELLHARVMSWYARCPENGAYERLYARIESLRNMCFDQLS
jgi:hypothetical protein